MKSFSKYTVHHILTFYFCSEFAIRNDSTHVAAFRYNSGIDEDSQVTDLCQ